jgi:hypothetical protein
MPTAVLHNRDERHRGAASVNQVSDWIIFDIDFSSWVVRESIALRIPRIDFLSRYGQPTVRVDEWFHGEIDIWIFQFPCSLRELAYSALEGQPDVFTIDVPQAEIDHAIRHLRLGSGEVWYRHDHMDELRQIEDQTTWEILLGDQVIETAHGYNDAACLSNIMRADLGRFQDESKIHFRPAGPSHGRSRL